MRAISTDALLLVDKPAGISSHDVVALVRRALGTRRVGHGGTLDPFATGLLVIMAGRGTRLLQFVPSEPKVYEATIRFGAETDSDDGTGIVVQEAPLPAHGAVSQALASFTGPLMQVPPAYSAKHVHGERAYAMARRGERPELAPVPVYVERWEIVAQDEGMMRARVSCGSGTYIRSLARDLGRFVGSAAHLEALRRLRVGPFDVSQSDDIERLRAGDVRCQDICEALGNMPREHLSEDAVRRVRNGRPVLATVAGSRAALLDPDGSLVAVAARRGDEWHPDVVLAIE